MNVQETSAPGKVAKLMISYSRKDKVFVKRLYDGLVAQGFIPDDIWVDWEEIALSADWMAEITKGIRTANAFIFVISPDSVTSEVCQKELDLADESNKRFIPILHREVGKGVELHKKLSAHNWAIIQDENELEAKLPDLVKAINTDLDWLDRHTQLFNKAKEWERKGRSDYSLLRGNLLQEAETFISEGATGKEPPPTQLHVEYVQASLKAAAAARRRIRIIAAVVGVALLALTVFSLLQWGDAVDSRNLALTQQAIAQQNQAMAEAAKAEADQAKLDAQAKEAEARKKERLANAYALAAEAINQRNNDTELGLMLALLAIQETAVDNEVLPEAKSALFASLSTPNVLYTWTTDQAIVEETAYDPTGTYVAIGDAYGLVQVINVEKREAAFTIQFDGSISGLDFSPDGKRLAISGGGWNDDTYIGVAKVWDVESQSEVFTLAGHDGLLIQDIDFSPDAQWIATAGEDGLVKIWSSDGGALREPVLAGHTERVSAIEFGPDSTRLISGSWDDTAIIWDVTTASPVLTLPMDNSEETNEDVESVAYSSDGVRVITGGYKTVILWDAASGYEIQRLYGNHATIYDVDFAPDNLSMVTASSGVKIWNGLNGSERFNLSSHHGEVNSVAFNRNGDLMVTGSWDYTSKLWAANLRIEALHLPQHQAPIWDANYSPDGSWIVTAGESGHVLVHDAQTGEVQYDLMLQEGVRIRVASFNPQDSQQLVTGDGGGNLTVWVLGEAAPRWSVAAHDGSVRSAVFSSNGEVILSSSFEAVKLWDARTGELLSEFTPEAGAGKAQFSPDGKRIVTTPNNSAQILDAETGEVLVELVGHTDAVLTAVFSRDGKYVYTGGYDNTVRKWDAETGEALLVISGHTGRVLDLDVSLDGTMVASASADTTVRVWDTVTGKEIYKYVGNTDEVSAVVFSDDGKRVLTASMDKVGREFIIDFDTLLQIAQEYELEPLTKEECQRYVKRDNCTLNLFGTAPVASDSDSGEAVVPSLTSGSGTNPVTLVVENNTSFAVDVFWIDFEGLERQYFSLAPGETYEQGTYSTHVWRVRDTDGNIVLDYTATEEPKQTLEITGDSGFGAGQPEATVATEVPPAVVDGAFYTEEFDGELGTWNRFLTTGSESQVETRADGGSLFVHLFPDEENDPRFYLVNDEFDYSSVQMEVTTTNHGNNANGVTLVCNYNGVSWYEFTISNSGLFWIKAHDQDAVSTQGYILLDNGGSAAIVSGPSTNVYRIVCNGNELKLFINDQLAKSFVDKQYKLTGGKIGIGVSSPQGLPVDVSFESLKVSEP